MNLRRVPIDETSGKTLGPAEPVTTPAAYLAHPSISADGKRILYTSALITAHIQRITLDASGDPKEEPSWVTTGTRRWSSPNPSPNNEWVAFYSLTQPEGQLYVSRTDGTGLRQLTGDAVDRVPRWSPRCQMDRLLFEPRRGPRRQPEPVEAPPGRLLHRGFDHSPGCARSTPSGATCSARRWNDACRRGLPIP